MSTITGLTAGRLHLEKSVYAGLCLFALAGLPNPAKKALSGAAKCDCPAADGRGLVIKPPRPFVAHLAWTFDLEKATSQAVLLLDVRCIFHTMRGEIKRGMLGLSSNRRDGLLPTEDVKGAENVHILSSQGTSGSVAARSRARPTGQGSQAGEKRSRQTQILTGGWLGQSALSRNPRLDLEPHH